jgi:hypothetical protein
MSSKAAKAGAGDRVRVARGDSYRGVKLQSPASPPKTSLTKLQDAVRHAVAKNAHALAGGK